MLLIAYGISFICALMLIAALFLYFRKRFRARVVSLFMLAAFFFLGSYTIKMAVAFWIRFTDASGDSAVYAALKSTAWAIAQGGTTLSLLILTYLMYTSRQDLFMIFPVVRGKEDKDDADS